MPFLAGFFSSGVLFGSNRVRGHVGRLPSIGFSFALLLFLFFGMKIFFFVFLKMININFYIVDIQKKKNEKNILLMLPNTLKKFMDNWNIFIKIDLLCIPRIQLAPTFFKVV